MAANVRAVQMTYIIISCNFFTTRASQPYKHKLCSYVLKNKSAFIKDIRKHAYFLVEIFRMGHRPGAACGFAATDGDAIIFCFFIPVRFSPV